MKILDEGSENGGGMGRRGRRGRGGRVEEDRRGVEAEEGPCAGDAPQNLGARGGPRTFAGEEEMGEVGIQPSIVEAVAHEVDGRIVSRSNSESRARIEIPDRHAWVIAAHDALWGSGSGYGVCGREVRDACCEHAIGDVWFDHGWKGRNGKRWIGMKWDKRR